MKITLKNYKEEIKKMDVSKFPEALKDSYEAVKEGLDAGLTIDELRETDPEFWELYLPALNKFREKNTKPGRQLKKPAGKTKNPTKTATKSRKTDSNKSADDTEPSMKELRAQAKKMGINSFGLTKKALMEKIAKGAPDNKKSEKPAKKSPTKSRKTATKKTESKKFEGKYVPEYTESLKLLKRYVNFHGKTKTQASVMLLIRAIDKALLTKKITKKSPYYDELIEAKKNLIYVAKNGDDPVLIKIREKTLTKLKEYVESQKIWLSVVYIKRYIGLYGRVDVFDKATRLHDNIKHAFDKQRIVSNDPYRKHLKEVQKLLEEYLETSDENRLKVISEGLNGFFSTVAAIFTADQIKALYNNVKVKEVVDKYTGTDNDGDDKNPQDVVGGKK